MCVCFEAHDLNSRYNRVCLQHSLAHGQLTPVKWYKKTKGKQQQSSVDWTSLCVGSGRCHAFFWALHECCACVDTLRVPLLPSPCQTSAPDPACAQKHSRPISRELLSLLQTTKATRLTGKLFLVLSFLYGNVSPCAPPQLQEQLERFMKMNGELRHKQNVLQAQLKSSVERKADMEADLKERSKEIENLREQLDRTNSNSLVRSAKAAFIDKCDAWTHFTWATGKLHLVKSDYWCS